MTDPSSVNHHLLLITLSGGVMDAKLAADWEVWTGHWSNYMTHVHAVIGASHNSMCKENLGNQSQNLRGMREL